MKDKEEGDWKLPRKGLVEGVLSQQLKDSLTRATKDPSTSVSNILNSLDNNLIFDSSDVFLKTVFNTLQADKLSPSSSEIGVPFKEKLTHITQQEVNQEKFLRKILVTHVKGSSLLDLSKQCLEPEVLDQFQTLDQLKLHCMSVGHTLAASSALTNVTNISFAKEWAGVKLKIRERITEDVQPEELRTFMCDSDPWVEGVWSSPQRQDILEKARSFDAMKSLRMNSNAPNKRKIIFQEGLYICLSYLKFCE